MDNRKTLKLAVAHTERLCENLQAGIDSAKRVLFQIKSGR
jgi:hypothetical protein